jgi:HYDIN/CFA65/VesB family protein
MTRYLLFLFLMVGLAADLSAQALDSDFRFSYSPPKGNQTAVIPDGSVVFPDTTVNLANPNLSQINTASFVITNRGSVPGNVNNITVSGGPFKVNSVPLLPTTLQPNQTLTFNIDFQPSQIGHVLGALRIDLQRPVNFTLDGNGVGPSLAYDFTVGGSTRTVSTIDTLTMPQTNLGEKSTATMRIRNVGNSDATISALASSHASFTLDNVPFLPFTLPAGASTSFNINFAPTLAGTLSASLKIGDVTFSLSGVGLGATLTYTSVVGSASSALATNGTVIFTLTRVGFSSSAQIQITNTGNATAFINSVSVAGPANGVFALTNLPALPIKVDSGAVVSFNLAFAPVALGQAAGTLRIDSQTFNLSGVGDAPPSLPGVSFSGISSAVDAAQQIGVGITLDNPYPVQLDGKLTLSFSSAAEVFGDDPAIAFASGGRTVNFTVPANSRNAVFGLSDSQIRFQTGTVAGNITLTATFATSAGGINLTTANAPATNISVRSSAPRVTSVQLVGRTASTFTIVITGYSPSRSLTAMDFTFTPYVDPTNKDLKLDTTTFNLPVSGPFSVWYLSSASQPFGSLFTATITFNVHGNIDAISSLSTTMTNSAGISNSRSVTLR